MTLLSTPAEVVQVLQSVKTVAVIGFHQDTIKPAHYVPEYMYRQGYTIIPVNPGLAVRGGSYFGQRAVSTLAEIAAPVDVVNIFRRSDRVHDHLADILAMNPLPRVVWMQLGIRDEVTARELVSQGINVIQDRCMLADHRALL